MMKYFMVDTLGDDQDRLLAFIDDPPDGLGLYTYCLTKGVPIANRYPEDAGIYLQPESPGIKLSSLLGNTQRYLIVHNDMKNIIEKYCDCKMEILPFTLYDHKRRVLSKEYWIVNPLGTFDCVDKDKSEIVYLDNTKADVVTVDRFVFEAQKLAEAPDLFRVPEYPTRYFISEDLAKAFQDENFTNIFLLEIDQMEK